MKLSHILLFAIISISILVMGKYGETVGKEHDLHQLVEALKANDVDVKEWQIYAREQRGEVQQFAEFEKEWKSIAKRFPEFQWTVEQNADVWKAVGLLRRSNNLSERILLTAHPPERYA
ncbi:hypothetical protein LC040_15740 [Bacillus tianshenii]|nr:hypothetical protein LC040_15740 [Bacillus tianshenii]